MKNAVRLLLCAALLMAALGCGAETDAARLAQALGEGILCVAPQDDGIYPFEVCAGGDGITPTNIDVPGTSAMLYAVFAAEGEGFVAWEMSTDIPDAMRMLSVYLDGVRVETLSGVNPAAKYAAEFTKGGTHILTFAFDCAQGCTKERATCEIRALHLADMEEAEEALSRRPGYPAVLFDRDVQVVPLNEGTAAIALTGEWDGAQAYMMPGEAYRFRILIGDGNDPDAVLIRDWRDGRILSLTMLDYDEEGYLFETAPYAEDGMVPFGGFDLFAFYGDTGFAGTRVIAFSSNGDARAFCESQEIELMRPGVG